MFHYSYKHNLPGISYYEYVYKSIMSKGRKIKMSVRSLSSVVEDIRQKRVEIKHIFGLRMRMDRITFYRLCEIFSPY